MDFLCKSHDISDIVLYVHPSTWLLDEKCKQKKFINTKDKVGKDLINIELFNGNKIFGIALFVPCVITYFNKNLKHENLYLYTERRVLYGGHETDTTTL